MWMGHSPVLPKHNHHSLFIRATCMNLADDREWSSTQQQQNKRVNISWVFGRFYSPVKRETILNFSPNVEYLCRDWTIFIHRRYSDWDFVTYNRNEFIFFYFRFSLTNSSLLLHHLHIWSEVAAHWMVSKCSSVSSTAIAQVQSSHVHCINFRAISEMKWYENLNKCERTRE